MKKILIALFIIGLAVYLTSDSEEKQKRKEYNVEQIEKNIAPYIKLNKQNIKDISNMRCLFCWKGNINMKIKIRSPCPFF